MGAGSPRTVSARLKLGHRANGSELWAGGPAMGEGLGGSVGRLAKGLDFLKG